MAFRRKTKQPDPDHPEPVEIDLGTLREWMAEPVMAELEGSGLRVKTYSLSQSGHQGGQGRTYKVLVHADDVEAVRAILLDAELLEG